jgi:MYXO-CTERM domain-containing protein
VRSDDGLATSGYATACFTVSSENAAPTTPVAMNPSNDSRVTSLQPAFSWAQSTDPEGEPIFYEVQVMDGEGMVVTSIAGVSGNVTATADELVNGAEYTWHVRAVDRSGANSAYSESHKFIVDVRDGDTDVSISGQGCGGCRTSGRGAASSFVLLALGTLGLVVRRRRR